MLRPPQHQKKKNMSDEPLDTEHDGQSALTVVPREERDNKFYDMKSRVLPHKCSSPALVEQKET